jgi:hypothetical protein
MKDPEKHTVAVLATILIALLLLICLEIFVVPVDWIRTHQAIHSLLFLTCPQPLLLWRGKNVNGSAQIRALLAGTGVIQKM